MRRIAVGTCLLVATIATGCGEGPDWPKCHSVSGRVLVDGKPAVRATVKFTATGTAPDGKTYSPSTLTDDDGAFRLTTFESGDGAPAGDYTVTVIATYLVKGGQDIPVADLLNGRYADPTQSRLKVTVKEGENALPPFDLKSR